MKMSPLNKYYFEKSYIVDKHDPNDEEKNLTHANFHKKTVFFAPLNAPRIV